MKRILPSYPLFVKDPNFSLWSGTDLLNDSNVQSWWGEEKKIYGFVRTRGQTFCFLGNAEDFSAQGVLKAQQTGLQLEAFSTDYEFLAGETTLRVRFVSPLPPDDPELLSLPVCFMEYDIIGDEAAELSVFVNRRIAYNTSVEDAREVGGDVIRLSGCETAFLGLKRQCPLSNNEDHAGADWGYFYVAGERARILDEADLGAYLADGRDTFSNTGEERYIAAFARKTHGAVLLGYDETLSIDYFGSYRKGYYLSRHTIFEALETVWENRLRIDAQLKDFDDKLRARAAEQGEEYLTVLYASLRQSVAAHKLVSDEDGNILFLSKECGSNGCIATVDVSYPSMPLYLLYNPELVKGMMRPILKFARMPVWRYDFAPHDVGTYPSCCGQAYGANRKGGKYAGNMIKTKRMDTHFPMYLLPAGFDLYDLNLQMPVEECADMLVMFLACYRADADISFFRENSDLCDKWVQYLVQYGLRPENQLCTDDFAGHLKNNINLAIKASVGIAAYAELLEVSGEDARGEKYRKTAERFAEEITAFGQKFSHLPITWDADDSTFSLKYNLAFDKILHLGLYGQDLLEREVDCYIARCGRFGTPLDNRETYTKSDWLMWAARLTDDKEKRKILISRLNAFLQQAPDRVPFGDWYDAESGKFFQFRARSVQGGCFILLMD